jgi:voltage-gated potassium channel
LGARRPGEGARGGDAEGLAMTPATDGAAVPGGGRRAWEDRLAGPMFFLAVLFLVVLAGLFHRYHKIDPDSQEASLILGGLAALWIVFLAEAAVRFLLRDRTRPAWRALASAAAVALVPPLRMGCRSQTRPDQIWLPGMGWQVVDGRLRRTLERAFSVPMILFALMVLPLFALEFWEADRIHAEPVLALWLDIGTSAIWLAFAVELVVMVSVADRPGRYCLLHWIDVAIVVLPAFETLPLFRLLRLGRLLRLDQLLRWGRLYRLKGLLARGWRAFLLLQVLQRLTGRSLESQLRRQLELLRAKEEELADLRRDIEELEARIARKAAARKAAAPAAPGAEAAGGATRLGAPG